MTVYILPLTQCHAAAHLSLGGEEPQSSASLPWLLLQPCSTGLLFRTNSCLGSGKTLPASLL